MRTKTAFVGLSHLGLVTSISWASLHPPVLALDNNQKKINKLRRGILEITEGKQKLIEPGLVELFSKVRKNYFPSPDFSQLKGVDLIFFAKDTPLDNQRPMRDLLGLIHKTIPFLKPKVTIIIMSQVPVGTCRQIKTLIHNQRPDLNFSLYHWVDTIIMTDAVNRFLRPERIIIGQDNTLQKINSILTSSLKLFHCPTFFMSYESAEVTKAFINLYLATSVTYANTLSDFCEATQANIHEIIPALKSDKRIGQYSYLQPNLRIAGGHLERDLAMLSRLAKAKKTNSRLVSLIRQQNQNRFLWVVKQIKQLGLKPKEIICLWGLGYKKNSTSTKNAASLEIIKKIGPRYHLRVYDPAAIMPQGLKTTYTRYKDKYQAVREASCLIILTDWEEFALVDFSILSKKMKAKNILDITGVYTQRKIQFPPDFRVSVMGIGKIKKS